MSLALRSLPTQTSRGCWCSMGWMVQVVPSQSPAPPPRAGSKRDSAPLGFLSALTHGLSTQKRPQPQPQPRLAWSGLGNTEINPGEGNCGLLTGVAAGSEHPQSHPSPQTLHRCWIQGSALLVAWLGSRNDVFHFAHGNPSPKACSSQPPCSQEKSLQDFCAFPQHPQWQHC